jgi:hypothetical protein
VPKFNVPPLPFIVNPAALIFPVNVAVPEVLVIDIAPVVVNWPIDWADAVPEIVTPPEPDVTVPEFEKLPCKVIKLDPGVRVEPLLMVNESRVNAVPRVVVPPEMVSKLKLVKRVEGNVLVAVNSTLPEPGVNVFEPVLASKNPSQIKVPPSVILIEPLLLLLLELPNVTVPKTVSCEFALKEIVAILLLEGDKLREAQVALLTLTVTVILPGITTSSVELGTAEPPHVVVLFQLPEFVAVFCAYENALNKMKNKSTEAFKQIDWGEILPVRVVEFVMMYNFQ